MLVGINRPFFRPFSHNIINLHFVLVVWQTLIVARCTWLVLICLFFSQILGFQFWPSKNLLNDILILWAGLGRWAHTFDWSDLDLCRTCILARPRCPWSCLLFFSVFYWSLLLQKFPELLLRLRCEKFVFFNILLKLLPVHDLLRRVNIIGLLISVEIFRTLVKQHFNIRAKLHIVDLIILKELPKLIYLQSAQDCLKSLVGSHIWEALGNRWVMLDIGKLFCCQ